MNSQEKAAPAYAMEQSPQMHAVKRSLCAIGTRQKRARSQINDVAAIRILAKVHEIARWQHRMYSLGASIEIDLEESVLDAVFDALGAPANQHDREPLYTAFYRTHSRPLTGRELNIIVRAARELAQGRDPDALQALEPDF